GPSRTPSSEWRSWPRKCRIGSRWDLSCDWPPRSSTSAASAKFWISSRATRSGFIGWPTPDSAAYSTFRPGLSGASWVSRSARSSTRDRRWKPRSDRGTRRQRARRSTSWPWTVSGGDDRKRWYPRLYGRRAPRAQPRTVLAGPHALGAGHQLRHGREVRSGSARRGEVRQDRRRDREHTARIVRGVGDGGNPR